MKYPRIIWKIGMVVGGSRYSAHPHPFLQERPNSWTKSMTKFLRIFLLVIHSRLYTLQLCMRFFFFKLTQPLTVSVKEKGGKPNRIPYPLPCDLSNPRRSLKSESCRDYAQRNLNLTVRSWIRLQASGRRERFFPPCLGYLLLFSQYK